MGSIPFFSTNFLFQCNYDLFSSDANRVCSNFFTQYPAEGSCGTDVMAYEDFLDTDKHYLFPPEKLVMGVLNYLVPKLKRAIMIYCKFSDPGKSSIFLNSLIFLQESYGMRWRRISSTKSTYQKGGDPVSSGPVLEFIRTPTLDFIVVITRQTKFGYILRYISIHIVLIVIF